MLVFTLLGQMDTGTTSFNTHLKLVLTLSLFVCVCNLCSLKPLDIEIMKRLGSRVNLIPVIAKADTLTPHDLQKFKENVSGYTSNSIILIANNK